jgi:hypothetical protein
MAASSSALFASLEIRDTSLLDFEGQQQHEDIGKLSIEGGL